MSMFWNEDGKLTTVEPDYIRRARKRINQIGGDPVARLQKLADEAVSDMTEVFVLDVGTAVMAWIDCSCGDQITAFGPTERAAVANVSGDMHAHKRGSVVHS